MISCGCSNRTREVLELLWLKLLTKKTKTVHSTPKRGYVFFLKCNFEREKLFKKGALRKRYKNVIKS